MAGDLKKTKGELLSALKRQLKQLRRSAKSYDEGELDEAERMATTAYTLLHEGRGKTKSLLGQLELKDAIDFVDSSIIDLTLGSGPGNALCYLHVFSNGGQHRAICRVPTAPIHAIDPPRFVPFSEWWEGIIFEDDVGNRLSRKGIVLEIRLRDGGSHVDSELKDHAYKHLAAEFNRLDSDGGKTIGMMGAHWETMRQIAWELDQTLINSGF